MGLPGSGKTTFATQLVEYLSEQNIQYKWFNADAVREQYADWDFSSEGRSRQAIRLRDLANQAENEGCVAIADFVCPLPDSRDIFNANLVVWMDTIAKSRYSDTNNIFVKPDNADYQITVQNDAKYKEVIQILGNKLRSK